MEYLTSFRFVLLICALLFVGCASAATETSTRPVFVPQNISGEQMSTFNTSQWRIVEEQFILPIPHIINHLGKLMSSSMKQLDTAFRPPTKINQPAVSTPSPLIEYSQSFRTTLVQMSQMLSNVLRTGNNKASKMTMLARSATGNINSIRRYFPRYLNSSRLADLVTSPLNKLTESSRDNVQLASDGATEFENLANLTKAVFDIVSSSLRVKEEHVSVVKANITAKIQAKNIVENQIISLNETNGELNRRMEQHKTSFTTCLNDVWNWTRNLFFGRSATKKSLCLEKKKTMENLEKNENDFRLKREENHQLHLDIERLQFEKSRWDNDIALLNGSSNVLNQAEKEIYKVGDGWKKLADHCLVIRSDISNTKTSLVDSRMRDDSCLDSSTTANDLMNFLTNKMKKIESDMGLVAKATEMYERAYSIHLADLVSQLEQMVTINDENPTLLEEKLSEACKNATSEIEKLFINEAELPMA